MSAIPLAPNWREIVTELYRRYGTYGALQDALSEQASHLVDHSQLVRLRSGEYARPTWQLGAALLNLYEGTKPLLRKAHRIEDEPKDTWH